MGVHEKLMRVQSKLHVPKSETNSFGNYKYRSCEQILEALKPFLNEAKATVVLTDEIIHIEDRFYIKATATFTDIEKQEAISTTALAREDQTKKGMDLAQITGSVSSYARKYALNGLFCIDDTEDPDSTNKHGKQASKTSAGEHSSEHKCVKCGEKVSIKVAKYSINKYKKVLCINCQKQNK